MTTKGGEKDSPRVKLEIFGFDEDFFYKSTNAGEDQGQTHQLRADPFQGHYEGEGIASPPYSLETLAAVPERSYILTACIAAMSTNVLGHGWHWVKRKGIDVEVDDPKLVAEVKRFEALFERPNSAMNMITMGKLLECDLEGIGNAYIEVSRTRKGEIGSFYHVPAQTIRVMRDAEVKDEEGNVVDIVPRGFVQIRDQMRCFLKMVTCFSEFS
jgi:capsid portal protein